MYIKISLIDGNGEEKDYITRNISSYINYNFSKGILIDLLLLSVRNELNNSLSKNIAKSARELSDEF